MHFKPFQVILDTLFLGENGRVSPYLAMYVVGDSSQ